jgi:hypothetical protein
MTMRSFAAVCVAKGTLRREAMRKAPEYGPCSLRADACLQATRWDGSLVAGSRLP